MATVIDRLEFAAKLAAGKRVLDIGGRGMPPCDKPGVRGPELFKQNSEAAGNSRFAHAYRRIAKNAAEYRVLDVRNEPDVHYVVNLSERGCMEKLHEVLCEYRPEVILCMETLEHVNYHYECLNEMAGAITRYGTSVFITLPNNKNWILNFLGWNHDHIVAFFDDIAGRFIERSDLGLHRIEHVACFQKYLWYWWFIYALSGFQPFSLGFLVKPRDKQGNP